MALPARPAFAGTPQPARLADISRAVFGREAPTAECIAHYESTDGAYLTNAPNEGPWQVSVIAHPWVNAQLLLTNWWYAAKVAYRISDGGRNWSPWATAGDCGV